VLVPGMGRGAVIRVTETDARTKAVEKGRGL
jgi:hypothetical protein